MLNDIFVPQSKSQTGWYDCPLSEKGGLEAKAVCNQFVLHDYQNSL